MSQASDDVRELPDALRWALYWIARTDSVPTAGEDSPEPGEWERWAEARRVLKAHHPDIDPSPASKAPDQVLPGDIVTPTRGRYIGVQCEVKDVLRGRYSTYRLVVVPVIPVADEWSVDYSERVQIVPKDRQLLPSDTQEER